MFYALKLCDVSIEPECIGSKEKLTLGWVTVYVRMLKSAPLMSRKLRIIHGKFTGV